MKTIRLSSWDLFYTETEPSALTKHESISYKSAADCYYVLSCNFNEFSSAFGGAIAIVAQNVNVKVLIEESLFVLCYSTSYICDYKRNTFSIKTLNYE